MLLSSKNSNIQHFAEGDAFGGSFIHADDGQGKWCFNYYNSTFKWLFKCEKIFGFKNLSGYGKTRMYGFLAERYLSYWFNKNANPITWPIIFYDISEKNY